MTVVDLITLALRAAKVLAPGEQPSYSEATVGLEVLNAMLGEWMDQHLRVFVIDNKQYELVNGKQDYTIGPGGDFDTERPVKIQSAGIIRYKTSALDKRDGLRTPLELIDSVRWAKIEEKFLASREPLQLYNDNAYPRAGLHLWPRPLC